MSEEHSKHSKLNQFFATAICGNDILSSTLYVSGIAVLFAGVYAPLVLLVIVGVLWLYKGVYTEVVEALPINGGTYSCLINGTSKTVAAVAGVMTILSYIATSVLSAKVGVEYLHTIVLTLPVIPATIVLLLFFAVLVIAGLKDSARVALGIFIFHAVTLTLFLVLTLIYFFNHGTALFHANILTSVRVIHDQGGFLPALYLAFSASLLGISGFESSANFVEEQEPGVFRKTLRNMLVAVGVFNPLIALSVLAVMPYETIIAAKDFLLADAAHIVGGNIFGFIMAINAFLVLSGAVLTSFIGISGLASRMTSDNVLPLFLAKQNKKGSYPRIVIAFFVLCSSILIATGGDLLSLAGVYTIAFLGVMSFFAIGNLILKETRTDLKRTYHAPIIVVVLAFTATFFGMLGNIRIDVDNLRFFETYFFPALVVVFTMIYRDYILKFFIRVTVGLPRLNGWLKRKFGALIKGRFVVFIHNLTRLHSLLHYVDNNETGWDITLVWCDDGQPGEFERFSELQPILDSLQKAGVFPHFSIKTLFKRQKFGPQAIEEVSQELDVPKNRILIGSIHSFHPFDYDELGGVRIIY